MSSQRLMSTVFLALCAAASTCGAADNRPTLELFPMPALDAVKETSRSAKTLESGLEAPLHDMDIQFQVYDANHCSGAQGDATCDEIADGLRKSYQQVLDVMLKSLPAMEQYIQTTRSSLSASLRTRVGLSLSPRDLQRAISQKPGSESESRQRTGARVGRLSQQFQRYYEMVSRARGTESTATMAADIYLDSREALDWIARIRSDIQSSQTELIIREQFAGLSPRMMDTVRNVRSMLFGETPALPDAPEPKSAPVDASIRALELN